MLRILTVFVGAMLAFLSNLGLQHLVRRRQELMAGNIALIILREYLNDTLLLKRGLRDHVEKTLKSDQTTPRWAQLWPQHFYFSEGLKFDFNDLAFLSLHGHAALVSRLAHCERLYYDLASVLASHRDVVAEIQKTIVESKLDALPWDEMNARVGAHLTVKAAMLTDGLFDRAERNPRDVIATIEALHRALVDRFGDAKVVKVDTDPKITPLNVEAQEQEKAAASGAAAHAARPEDRR